MGYPRHESGLDLPRRKPGAPDLSTNKLHYPNRSASNSCNNRVLRHSG